MAEQLTLATLAGYFADEAAAWEKVESIRWPEGPVCPHCGTVNEAYLLQAKNGTRTTSTGKVSYRRVWKCGACREQFSVLVGTIFEDSKLPLSKWLYAIHLLCSAKNGVSAHELHRSLGITYKSAWFMAHRIRYAMEQEPLRSKLTGVIEADETYVGGKAKNMHAARRAKMFANGTLNPKTPVFSLVQRDGEVRSQVMPTVTGKNIGAVLAANVDKSATLMTDQAKPYTLPGREFAAHHTVDHSAGEYVRGDVYSNTVEGYFSQLKRSIDGTHHHVSAKHLGRYVGEFDYRYNTRKIEDGERTVMAVRKTTGKRLRYKGPIGE